MEDQNVDHGRHDQDQFHAEEDAVIIDHRLCIKERQPGDHQQDKAQNGEGQDALVHFGSRHALEGQTEQAKVHHDDRADKQHQDHHVGGFQHRPHVERLAQRNAPRGLVHP